ncbi:MAG: MarR family transcriptional regulator [Pseudomonadota bacterium]
MAKRPAPHDMIDEIVADFARERPDIDTALVETASRIIFTGRKMEERATRTVQALGFHYTDYDTLGMLRTAGPPYELTPAELLRRVMITSGAMTACLKRLEAAGMITRRVDERDRRVKHVRLTERGLVQADAALSERYADAAKVIARLSEAEMKALNKLLRKAGAER